MDTEAHAPELGRQMLARRLIKERLVTLGASDLESYVHARLYSDWLAKGASRPDFWTFVINELGEQ